MYSREIDGQVFDFGVSGKLIMNGLVMYDRQTGTLWSQVLGEAVEGPLKGTRLEYLPSWQTTYSDWKARHPDSLFLEKGYSGLRDPYLSYYASDRAGVLGETVIDDRLGRKEFVIGVTWNGQEVAFPFRRLSEQPVVNTEIGGTPVVVVFDSKNASGVVFKRQVGEQELTFLLVEGTILEDAETGSRWEGMEGMAVSGPLEGEQLERIPSTQAFWFGWKDYHPSTRVWGVDAED